MRLSPGSGSVRYISGNRARPYAVHPPCKHGKRPKAICSVSDRATGYAVLRLWHAGKYKAGMEDHLSRIVSTDPATPGELLNLVADDADGRLDEWIEKINQESAPTVAEVYEKFLAYRRSPVYTRKCNVNALNSAYTKLEPYHHHSLDSIGVDDWQEVVNAVAEGYSKTTVNRVVSLIKNLYQYALVREWCTKDYGLHVKMPVVKPEQHHQDFSDEELDVLWSHKDNEVVKMILVMIYSGFRIGAFARDAGLQTHLEAEIPYFKGGVKTEAGRGRIVPIHSAILPMVREMDGVYLCGKGYVQFYRDMKRTMQELEIDTPLEVDTPLDSSSAPDSSVRYHTPHSCRHTFSRLCESYDVRDADRKRLMGHSFGNDITNRVYGHRSVAELKEQIEKIKVPGDGPGETVDKKVA